MPYSFPLQLICMFSPYKAVAGLRMRNILSEVLVGNLSSAFPRYCVVYSVPLCLTHVIKPPSTIDMICMSITDFVFMIGLFKSKCSAYCYLLATWIITFLTKLSNCAALPRERISRGIWNFASPCQVLHLNMKLLHINKMS